MVTPSYREELISQILALQEQKKGLMQRLLTGQVRVKTFERENRI